MSSWAFVLQTYKKWKQSSCNIAGIDIELMKNDSESKRAQCVTQFQHDFYDGILKTTNMLEAVCTATKDMNDCHAKLGHLPLEVQYRFEEEKESTMEFDKMCANLTTSPAPPAGKNIDCVTWPSLTKCVLIWPPLQLHLLVRILIVSLGRVWQNVR